MLSTVNKKNTGTADIFRRKLDLFLEDIPDRCRADVVEQVTAMRIAGSFQI